MAVVIRKKTTSADSSRRVKRFTLDATQALDMEVFLPETPADPERVVLNIVSGTIQFKGTDFQVDGNRVYWADFGLETILSEGDKIIITYDI